MINLTRGEGLSKVEDSTGKIDILVYNYLTKLNKNATEPHVMGIQDTFAISNRSSRSIYIIRIAKTKNLTLQNLRE